MPHILPATSAAHIAAVQQLFREYETFLDVDLCFQDFENKLATLPGKYAPPQGALYLALADEDVARCIALRQLAQDICEMKRLYIRPHYRGLGIGRRLAAEMIDVAVRRGYSTMVLGMLDYLKAAMALYDSLGFVKRDPYYHNPLGGVYWKLDLKNVKTADRG